MLGYVHLLPETRPALERRTVAGTALWVLEGDLDGGLLPRRRLRRWRRLPSDGKKCCRPSLSPQRHSRSMGKHSRRNGHPGGCTSQRLRQYFPSSPTA